MEAGGDSMKNYRAAIIGHTGHGNYGHGLDVAFMGFPNIEIVAIADPDEAGRTQVQTRTHAPTTYADYRLMLERERPNLVAVAPRFVGDRVAMVEAAAAVGAHMYVEKPLARSLADADAMIAACERAHVKMAVAHQGRLHPVALHAMELVQGGEIGRLRLIRGYGKMDRRGGGQDLMILGTHVLDQMRLFGGDATWASAEILDDARLTTSADLRPGDEEIAPIAGNGLRATYGFTGVGDNGSVVGTFESYAGLGEGEELFGMELVGEKGQLSLRGGFTKRLLRYPRPFIVPGEPFDRWQPVITPHVEAGDVPGDEAKTVDSATLVQRANHRLVRDLLDAIENDREPASSGERARAALEMIQAIAAAHVHGGRVTLPLQERTHPFETAMA
jgi:predicted dehydrogenase